MRLYIIRHADPDYANHTITAAGHLEAHALAKRLAGMELDRIFCSPLPRAIHTARYTTELTKHELDIRPWMAEPDWQVQNRDGSLMPAWNIESEIVREHQPFPHHGKWNDWGPFAKQNLESKYGEIAAHSDRFMASLGYEREGGRYRIVRSSRERIAVFCHLGFGFTWLSHLLDLPLPLVWSGFWIAPSSVTTVLMDERSAEWATPRCLGLGDTSHLYEAGLPASRMGITANFE